MSFYYEEKPSTFILSKYYIAMIKNMGSIDRTLRIIMTLIIAYLSYSGIISGTLGILLLAAAVILLITSVFSFCPIYTLMGVNTCELGKK